MHGVFRVFTRGSLPLFLEPQTMGGQSEMMADKAVAYKGSQGGAGHHVMPTVSTNLHARPGDERGHAISRYGVFRVVIAQHGGHGKGSGGMATGEAGFIVRVPGAAFPGRAF